MLGLHGKPNTDTKVFDTGFNALCTKKTKHNKLNVQSYITLHENEKVLASILYQINQHWHFHVSIVGFARQTNTDTKVFDAGFNALCTKKKNTNTKQNKQNKLNETKGV